MSMFAAVVVVVVVIVVVVAHVDDVVVSFFHSGLAFGVRIGLLRCVVDRIPNVWYGRYL